MALQRQQLADAVARYMMHLGLECRARPVPTLNDYLAGKRDDPAEPNHAQASIEPVKVVGLRYDRNDRNDDTWLKRSTRVSCTAPGFLDSVPPK